MLHHTKSNGDKKEERRKHWRDRRITPIAVISNDCTVQIMIAEAVCHAGSLMSVVNWLKAKSGGNRTTIIFN